MFKKLVFISLILSVIGCDSQTKYGSCVGAFDNKDPKKIYKIDGWNLAMGIIFFEMVVPPVSVVVDETFCPIGDK